MNKRKDGYDGGIIPAGDAPSGGFVTVDGERYYMISGVGLMPPFLMNIPSDVDLWMFIASNGGLTAGRADPDGSVFPYETADKIYNSHYHTGPVSLIRAAGGDGEGILWEPFTACPERPFNIERNLYKNVTGNRIIFEEINHDLKLAFNYRWSSCDEFGHIRTVRLENRGESGRTLKLLDGLRNILPFGAPLSLYQQSSSLVDAYKRTDLYSESGMAVFSLTSRIIDRAEAAEELRANVAWSAGLENRSIFLSADSIDDFRNGETPEPGSMIAGRPGNYILVSDLDLPSGGLAKWHIAVDSGRDHIQLAELRNELLDRELLDGRIEARLDEARDDLKRIVGSADGIQLAGHEEVSAHHFANVLFNCMRGGIFSSNYDILKGDFTDFVMTRNRHVAKRLNSFLAGLPERMAEGELIAEAEKTEDADMIRLAHEYLPLYFGRRHGDPSRPWNRFTIKASGTGGKKVLSYEGNWRDIFQNWEALALSFPGFLPCITAKFVNASTVDGFNPYRITRDGIDWEVIDPDDPWSYIGYWGDHQIIYLLKFLEALPRYYPGRLEDMLEMEIFSYADVPYRIKPYEDIVKDPESTILYDADIDSSIERRVESTGSDGRLLQDPSGSVYHVTLLEKLLVPVLSKISNLVPEGGIWMNTQRPEWNDANNALVGNGLSVVTLCYLRRHLSYLRGFLEGLGERKIPVSLEVIGWFEAVSSTLADTRPLIESPGGLEDGDRKKVMDELQRAFSSYREKAYTAGFSGKGAVDISKVADFFKEALLWIDHSITANRREDGLFHSYNLIEISEDGEEASIRNLYEMLEGQVAVLSSGLLKGNDSRELLASLFESPMYSEDRNSFLLYPERELPGFMERNVILEEDAEKVPLLYKMLEADETSVIARDVDGVIRFNGDFANAADLRSALDSLALDKKWKERAKQDRKEVLGLFEKAFNHKEFTGRSGTMYGYEGIGCIYWHMVSKLLLASQETAVKALEEDACAGTAEALSEYYYRVRSGLGFEKTASEYGAFPTDPYSHTPSHSGAQQPGMTGQVKEEIITRFGELGVKASGGKVKFDPVMLKGKEFLEEKGRFDYYDTDGARRSLELEKGTLAFTFCQVPVVYHLTGGNPRIKVIFSDGKEAEVEDIVLGSEISASLFARDGTVARIDVWVSKSRAGR